MTSDLYCLIAAEDPGIPSYLHIEREQNSEKKYFLETHGCQMNVADTEIV